jgi:Zn-dependent protease with chaperone function
MGGADTLEVDYFDGRSSRLQPILLQINEQAIHIIRRLDGVLIVSMALHDVQWPERTRYGTRIAQLPDGASLQSRDAPAWDAWVAAHVQADSLVVRAQQSWRGVGVALALLVGVVAAMYQWGLPVAARAATTFVPAAVDETLGRNALAQIDNRWMKPSKLPVDVQARIRQRFATAVQKTYGSNAPQYQLEFRQSTIGPNAFALPGGTMVMTDELVNLVNDDDVVLGVMGHELGHVTQRHGIRQLVQVTALQTVLGVAFGDYGSLITTAPLILGTMGYSREHEREADAESIRFMRAAGISPLVMVKFFEAVRAEQKTKTKETPLGISIISSHPADEERIEVFRQAAR